MRDSRVQFCVLLIAACYIIIAALGSFQLAVAAYAAHDAGGGLLESLRTLVQVALAWQVIDIARDQ